MYFIYHFKSDLGENRCRTSLHILAIGSKGSGAKSLKINNSHYWHGNCVSMILPDGVVRQPREVGDFRPTHVILGATDMFRKLIGVLVGLAFFGTAGSANSVVIDFESATTGRCQVTVGGSVDGFTLSPAAGSTGGGFNTATSCSFIAPTANSGSKYMLNFDARFGEFTFDDGTFTLDSLFVHANYRVGATTVRFLDLDGIGGAVLHTLDVAIVPAWQQIFFPSWFDIKTFT